MQSIIDFFWQICGAISRVAHPHVECLAGSYAVPEAEPSPLPDRVCTTGHGSQHPLYHDYRLALAAQDEERALQAIRAILRSDPHDAGARAEATRLENKIFERKLSDLRAALAQRNQTAIFAVLADLERYAGSLDAAPGPADRRSPLGDGRLAGSPLHAPPAGDLRPPNSDPARWASPAPPDLFAAPARSAGTLWWVLGGVVVAVAALAFGIFEFGIPYVQQQQAAMADRAALERIVQETSYFSGPRAIPQLHAELGTLSRADVACLRTLAVLTERMLDSMRTADFSAMKVAAANYQMARSGSAINGLDILPRFDEVAAKLQYATQLEAALSTFVANEQAYTALASLQEKAVAVDSALSENVPDEAAVKAKLGHLANVKLANGLRVLLQGASMPTQDRAWFQNALEKIKLAPDEQEAKDALDIVRQIVGDWRFVESQPLEGPRAELQARMNAQVSNTVWPVWLRELAAAKMAGTAPPPPATPGTPPRDAAPDGPPGGSPPPPPPAPGTGSAISLYFVSGDSHLAVALPASGPGVDYFLQTAGKPEEELQPFAGDASKGLGPFGESFKVQNGTLYQGGRPPAPPYAFVGKRGGVETYRVYVAAGRDDKPVFGMSDGGLTRQGDDLVVDFTRLPGAVSQPLALRLPSDFGVKGSRLTVVDLHSGRASISPAVEEMKAQLQKLTGNASVGETASADPEDNEIRAEVRRLSERPKGKDEKKPVGGKPTPAGLGGRTVAGGSGDLPADVGLTRPAEMLAALFDKYWAAQVGGNSNPAERIRAELAKKPEQADWPALESALKADFQYATAEWLGKSEFDKRLEWVQQAEKLSERVCAAEAKRQAAQGSAAQSQARAARFGEEAKALEAHPLLHGQIPPGVYTLLVRDGDRTLPLIDFKIP